MTNVRRAVIDVGTNSVKLLIADVAGNSVTPLREESHQTRLGKGFYENHTLQPKAIAETAQSVAGYATTARGFECATISLVATSAVREAKNRNDLISAIQGAAALDVRVLSGDEEADWVFRGVTTDPELSRLPLLLVDVGGGSTEFILGWESHQHFRRSLPLGTVRLLEKFPINDPPGAPALDRMRHWVRTFLGNELEPDLGTRFRQAQTHAQLNAEIAAVRLVGTGGTATILGRMMTRMEGFDRVALERVRIRLSELRLLAERLWSMPLAARQLEPGLPANRADVILFGVVVYEVLMEQFSFDELRISTRSLRFAAVLDPNG